MYLTVNPKAEKREQIQLYYEDVGDGQPVVLIHGWPLSHRMWEYQVPALVDAGYRVIRYDRRGFGDSSKPWHGYNYDNLAEDLNGLINQLELQDAVLVGFSMGGGEVARYLSRFGSDKIVKAVFLSSIAPFMLQTDDNTEGVPDDVFEQIKAAVKDDRLGFLKEFGPQFVNYEDNKDNISLAQLDFNFNIAAMASPKGTLDCVDAFGKTDLREDLKSIQIPTLFMHGDADSTVPMAPTAQQGHKLVPESRLEIIEGAPHGCTFTHAAEVNDLLLQFLK